MPINHLLKVPLAGTSARQPVESDPSFNNLQIINRKREIPMMTPEPFVYNPSVLFPLLDELTDQQNADFCVFRGELDHLLCKKFAKDLRRLAVRPNFILLLSTPGGAAEGAYVMARAFQDKDGQVTVWVPGICSSAGGLVVIGAKEIVMGDHGELGPLDAQIPMTSSPGRRYSALDLKTALQSFTMEANEQCLSSYGQLLLNNNGLVPAEAAVSLSVRLTSGVLEPVFSQFNPIYFGAAERGLQATADYGERLNRWSSNLKGEALSKLVEGYSSHKFIIDRDEAQTLFNRVRRPGHLETRISEILLPQIETGLSGPPNYLFLNEGDLPATSPQTSATGQTTEQGQVEDGGAGPAVNQEPEQRQGGNSGQPPPATPEV
jgi:hypothetical protein